LAAAPCGTRRRKSRPGVRAQPAPRRPHPGAAPAPQTSVRGPRRRPPQLPSECLRAAVPNWSSSKIPCAAGRPQEAVIRLIDAKGSSFTERVRSVGRSLHGTWSGNCFMGIASAEADHPPIDDFVGVDGMRLHYFARGSGTPVVLLHGNGSMIGDFLSSGITERIASGHRVIAFDRPGFGYSERPRDRRWGPSEQARLLLRAFASLGIE